MKTKDTKRSQRGRVEGFEVAERECIWMKAGVVNFKVCDNAGDCFGCPFDKSMRIAMGKKARETGESEAKSGWAENLANN